MYRHNAAHYTKNQRNETDDEQRTNKELPKNWLFAGHDDAGRSHALLYTLIASADAMASIRRST